MARWRACPSTACCGLLMRTRWRAPKSTSTTPCPTPTWCTSGDRSGEAPHCPAQKVPVRGRHLHPGPPAVLQLSCVSTLLQQLRAHTCALTSPLRPPCCRFAVGATHRVALWDCNPSLDQWNPGYSVASTLALLASFLLDPDLLYYDRHVRT